MIWKPMFSEFSVISALIFFTLYTLVCSFLCKKVGWRTLRAFGIGIGLLVLRCLLPFEIPGVQLITVSGWYATLFEWLNPSLTEGITPMDVLLIVWAAGSLICLLRLVYRLHMQRKLIKGNAIEADHRLSRIYRGVLQDMSCAVIGNICLSDEFSSPMMAGFLKPHILFPKDMTDFTDGELRFIFRHEITHFKNRDLWLKLSVELLCCALWWNPAVYLLRICISQLLEMRCDSLVCESLDGYKQFDYSQTLLQSFKKTVHRPMYITAEYLGCPSKERVKQRFSQILHAPSQPKKKGLSALIVALAICAFVGSYCIIVQPGGMPDGIGDTYEIDSTSFENSFILRMPDGALKVFVDNQLYAEIEDDQLNDDPFSGMIVIDADLSSKEE